VTIRGPSWLAAAVALGAACADPVAFAPAEPAPGPPLDVGDSRTIELRFLRFDVEGFERRLTLEDLQALPPATLAGIWVLDLDLRPLSVASLSQIRDLSDEEAAGLPTATRNMRRLLTMTPDDADLDGTKLEELISLSAAVGIPPARCLADLLGIGVTDPLVPVELAAEVFADGLVATHPAAQWRPGPVDEDHPDGRWPVAPGAIPVTLADVADNFDGLAEKFGPSGGHPGFVDAAEGVLVTEADFALVVKVNAQALPYDAVDLQSVAEASVDSKSSQLATLFDFSDPEWLRLEGLVEEPLVRELRHTIREHDGFVPGGDQRDPAPQGNSAAWGLDPWIFEHVMAEVGFRRSADVPAHCDTYELATGADVFTACVEDDGWVQMETFNDVGDPPPPAYLWDLQLEIAQTRLHDGGLSEGEADVEVVVRDVPIGIGPDELTQQIRANAEHNPQGLADLARALAGATVGNADFYYYRALPDAPPEQAGDWLYFVLPGDIALDVDGDPVREYAYAHPGFFEDAALTQKVSDTRAVEGDVVHEKVRIRPGDVLHVEDDQGRVYRIDVADKPSTWRVALDVIRVR
jgi:hypothetical protein